MVSNKVKLQHLFLRAGFGESPARIKSLESNSIDSVVDSLFTDSAISKDLDYISDPLHGRDDEEISSAKIVLLILKSRKQLMELNLKWLDQMSSTKAVLREKMTFFWHNHFATSAPFGYPMQNQNNMFRKNALGKFSDLLKLVAKDPSMIIYLNNQQNTKDAPNENFAREVMELFTLGEGHYTEKDIKEAARAFTGWKVDKTGRYEFNDRKHDFGEKEFFGQKGNFNGEEILSIILKEKQTASFIVKKIWREFVSEVEDQNLISTLADQFYQSDYSIADLLKTIYKSDWFYDEKYIGCKISSPTELLVRYKRLIHAKFKTDKTVFDIQKVLGQMLFFPPNVAGWKGGKNWIDSASLTLRLNLANVIIKGEGLNIKPKPEFEDMMEIMPAKSTYNDIEYDFSQVIEPFKNQKDILLTEVILDSFIQCKKDKINKNLLMPSGTGITETDKISTIIMNLMLLPEFQLI